MLDKIPSREDMISLVGVQLYDVWHELIAAVNEKYDMERIWNTGGKRWVYEYKYRRGGKTLCALYAKQGCVGFMVIFGKDEREKFEAVRHSFSADICKAYDEAATYHDGKWVMFEPADTAPIPDYIKLLAIKRKPNIK